MCVFGVIVDDCLLDLFIFNNKQISIIIIIIIIIIKIILIKDLICG